MIASRPLLRDVPAEHIDIVLACSPATSSGSGDEPAPPTSPYLREHQSWQG